MALGWEARRGRINEPIRSIRRLSQLAPEEVKPAGTNVSEGDERAVVLGVETCDALATESRIGEGARLPKRIRSYKSVQTAGKSRWISKNATSAMPHYEKRPESSQKGLATSSNTHNSAEKEGKIGKM